MQVTAVSLARTVVLAAAMSGVMLTASPVVAANDAAHTLADKFSRAAEDAEHHTKDLRFERPHDASSVVDPSNQCMSR